MEGQRVRIHIHKSEYMRVQRLNGYRYSVESPDSPYFEEVGWIFTDRDVNLSAGHTYDVRFSDGPKTPRIEEVFGEVIEDESEVIKLNSERSKAGPTGD